VSDYITTNIHITSNGMPQERLLRHALDFTAADRVLFSTDYPFHRPGATAVEHFFDTIPHPAERTKIASGNAEALFRLTAPALPPARRGMPETGFGTDFNYDFGVTIDESVAPGEYNFRAKAEFEAMGSDFFASDQPFEMPGRSCFLQTGGRVFHTYSQYARGLESTGGSYYFLDLTALGRQEEWEEPKGRSESARSATPDFAS
jgi:hypothetical protein